jgi:hypothetical protein
VPSESKCEGCKKRNTECEYKPVAGSSEPSPSASYAFDAVPSDFAGHSHSQAYVVPNSPYGRGPSDPSQAQTHAASGSSYGPPDSGHRDIHLYCDPPVVSQYPDLRQVHPSVAMSDGSDWGQSTADSPEHFRGIPNSYLDYDYNMAQESTTYPSTHFTSSSTIGQPSGYGGSQDPHSLSLASFPPM